MERYNIVVNFISGLVAHRIKPQAISNSQLQNLTGFVRVLAYQANVYGHFVTFLVATVSYLKSLELFTVGGPMKPYQVDYSAEKLLAVTAKLDMFSADFKSNYHEIVLWASAVKIEIRFVSSWFGTLFSKPDISNLFVSNSKLREFLKPIADTFSYMMTTDVGKWVWANLWEKMVTNHMIDFRDMTNRAFNTSLDDVLGLERLGGYSESVTFNSRSSAISRLDGIKYELKSVNPGVAITRSDYMINVNLVNPCSITNDSYPCFRVTPTLANENTASTDLKIMADIREGTKSVDIPLYFRFNYKSPVNFDMIAVKQPLFMPSRSRLRSADVTPEADATIEYIANNIDDILFLSSKDLYPLFTLVRV